MPVLAPLGELLGQLDDVAGLGAATAEGHQHHVPHLDLPGVPGLTS